MSDYPTATSDIEWDICAGCGENWPTTELGPYSLCPNCSHARNDLDERGSRLTGLFGE